MRLVQVAAVGLPLFDELRIEAPVRGATLQAAKRAEATERLVQGDAAGETERPLALVLRFVSSFDPAGQPPQPPPRSLLAP